MTDIAGDAIASQLKAGIADARERQRIERRAAEADDMERELALYKAGIPVHSGVGELFLSAYDSPLDPDEIQSAWYRRVLDKAPPSEVAQRITAKNITRELRRSARNEDT